MLSKIKKIGNPRILCAMILLAVFAVQMVMHLNVDNLLLDDWAFFGVMETGENIPAWLVNRWETWSSRLLIEAILCVLTHSIWAFRVLDSAVMVLLAYALARLSAQEQRPAAMAFSALMVTAIPFAILRSTGWMATSLNYYWPLAATAYALIPLADSLWGRQTGRGCLIAAVLCALLGANQEQTSAVLMGSYLVLGGYQAIRSRRLNGVHTLVFLIALVQLALHLICPGNAVRAQQSVALVNLRDYEQFSFIDKLSVGLTSTSTLLLFTKCPILLLCCAAAAGSSLDRRRGLLAMAAALIPAGFMLFAHTMRRSIPLLQRYAGYVLQLGPERILMDGQMEMMFGIIVLLGMAALALYLCIGHRRASFCAVFAYAVGFAARMALSFSPTVVESGERTMLPLYGAMMLCGLLCIRDEGEKETRVWGRRAALAVCAAVAFANVMRSFVLAA